MTCTIIGAVVTCVGLATPSSPQNAINTLQKVSAPYVAVEQISEVPSSRRISDTVWRLSALGSITASTTEFPRTTIDLMRDAAERHIAEVYYWSPDGQRYRAGAYRRQGAYPYRGVYRARFTTGLDRTVPQRSANQYDGTHNALRHIEVVGRRLR
jgi:hypothetical protein